MLVKSKILKIIALIVWGLLLFLLISNQEMSLEDIRTTKYLPLKSSEYQFTQSGYAAEDLIKYRVVKKGKTLLFGFSDADEFVNHLNLSFKATKRINFVGV